jgi:hypothetical protein
MLTKVPQEERFSIPACAMKSIATSRDLLIIGPLLDDVRSAAKLHIEAAVAKRQQPAEASSLLHSWHSLLFAGSARRRAFTGCELLASLPPEQRPAAAGRAGESFPLRMQMMTQLAANLRQRGQHAEIEAGHLLPRAGDAAPPPFVVRVLRVGPQISRSVREEVTMLEKNTPLAISPAFYKLLFAGLYFSLASPYESESEEVHEADTEKDDRGEEPDIFWCQRSLQVQGVIRVATLCATLAASDYEEAVRDSAVAEESFSADPKGALRDAVMRFYYQLLLASGDLGDKHNRLLFAATSLSPSEQYQILNVAVTPPGHLKRLRDAVLRDFSMFLSLVNAVIASIRQGLLRCGNAGKTVLAVHPRPRTAGDENGRYDAALGILLPHTRCAAQVVPRPDRSHVVLTPEHRDILSPSYLIQYGLRHPVIVPKVDNDSLMQNLRTARQKGELETAKHMRRLAEHDEMVTRGKSVSARRRELMSMTTHARAVAVTKIVESFGPDDAAAARTASDQPGPPLATHQRGELIGNRLEQAFEHDPTDYLVLKGAPRRSSWASGSPYFTSPAQTRGPPLIFDGLSPTWEPEVTKRDNLPAASAPRSSHPSSQSITFQVANASATTLVPLSSSNGGQLRPASRGFEQVSDFKEYVGLVQRQRQQVEQAEAQRRRTAERKRDAYLRSLPAYVQVFLQ